MILGLLESLEEISDNFRDWIVNDNNQSIILVFFIVGLLIFSLAWHALHKND